MIVEIARFRALMVVTVGLAGCVVAEADDGLGSEAGFESAVALAPQNAEFRTGPWADFRAEACPEERQIAKAALGETSCPKIRAWSETPLFEDGTPWLAAQAGTLPYDGPLWCRYSWDPEPGDNWDDDGIDALEESVEISEISEFSSDCEVVHPQQSISEVVATTMRDLFRQEIRRVDANDLETTAGVPSAADRSPVSVTVIDTMPETLPANPRSSHGQHMGKFILDIACPGGAAGCAVQVGGVLGLPRYAGGVDKDRGGFVGSQGDLAAAIIETVQRWSDAGASMPLIINLSVGWDPHAFGGQIGGFRTTAVDAVYAALEVASCHGALVVVAAGNDAGMCTTGATSPANWEALPAPDDARCADLGLPEPGSTATYQPLVYAVGGLDIDESVMPGSRDDSRPRMMATSTYAIAGGQVRTPGITGTSVAAASVSGAAALLWSYNPSSDAHGIMQTLFENGESLGDLADFGLSNQQVESRKLDVCAALDASCSADPDCPSLKLECLTATPTATVATALADAEDATVDYSVAEAFPASTSCALNCDPGSSATVLGSMGVDLCAATDPVPIARYLSPQPQSAGCSNCTLQGNSVNASLDEGYDGYDVENVMVTVTDSAGETRFDFGDVPLEVDSITRLELGQTYPSSTITEARISVTFVGKRPLENELIYH